MKRAAVPPLDARAVYRAPSGKLCRWVPKVHASDPSAARALFEYVGRDGSELLDGFWLTPGNFALLRRVN